MGSNSSNCSELGSLYSSRQPGNCFETFLLKALGLPRGAPTFRGILVVSYERRAGAGVDMDMDRMVFDWPGSEVNYSTYVLFWGVLGLVLSCQF